MHTQLDDDTLAFARRVFQYARTGETAPLAELLAQGLPAKLRNERGDSLLMLACYHGHLETARVLLDHGADPRAVDAAGIPVREAAAKMGAVEAVDFLNRLLDPRRALSGCAGTRLPPSPTSGG